MDVNRHVVTVAGRAVHVLPAGFEILVAFLEHPGWVFSHAQLLRRARVVSDSCSNVLHVHLYKLRKVIGRSRIVMVRGFGWKFEAQYRELRSF